MSQTPASPPPYSVSAPVGGTGALPYGLGFLAYLPIPFLGTLIAGIAMAASYGSQRRLGGIAAENGRNAANWGLTVIAVLVLVPISALVLWTASGHARGFFPTGIPILVYGALNVAHLVVLIRGLRAARAGQVFVNGLAVPFIRTPA